MSQALPDSLIAMDHTLLAGTKMESKTVLESMSMLKERSGRDTGRWVSSKETLIQEDFISQAINALKGLLIKIILEIVI